MLIARAPVRISFGGGGTDLAAYYTRFGGFVVSAAITRYCYVVARTPADRRLRIYSADYQITETFRCGEPPVVEEPLILPKAAIERFLDRGLRETGINLFLAAEVPPGTGLGSSSAMAISLIRALAASVGMGLTATEAAGLACWLEIERLGMPIGKQDQYASAFGGLNTIEFTADGVSVRPLRAPADVVAALSARLLLFSTGKSRDSAGILRQQRADTGSKPAVIESLHRIKALAEEMCEALMAADLDGFGGLLDRAWWHKKQLSGKISSATIDQWYEAAREAGALGGKIAGAGGGGFLLLYCPPRRQKAVRAAMAQFGLRELAFGFDFAGAQVLAAGDASRFNGRVPVRVVGTERRSTAYERAGSFIECEQEKGGTNARRHRTVLARTG
ncbi:MAG: GHMP kinase [Ardenticatenaceae bacterium]|nr:GHMP kinase [Ardenticatenaceae bacterium]